jgi:S-DNA-T family DNA segregation ATPase FtsK/SpoIIIE
VGITDEPWELVRTYYVPFEDGTDMVSPVVARAMALLAERGRPVAITAADNDETPKAVDHLADIAAVCAGAKRVRTQTVLARLIADNPDEYDGWTLTDLSATLAECGVTPVKSNGVMTVRTEDVAAALAARDDESAGEATGSRGVLPTSGNGETPRPEQGKRDPGRRNLGQRATPGNPGKPGQETPRPGSLPDGNPEGSGRDG